ncbi:hypothetical protein [Xanthovirga aplysinae]|uniref:hypothetical protein n=1 Tax=Xanthovirga aplysinae TaxID=2529853 RepID=UPI0012BC3C6D|nr:hypothetical protein [Xanthovirga aplysinae]MTI29262.1 hypothetical protein [Xanthovirga aplysinae]
MNNPSQLKIDSLKGEWCDKDLVLLHACFQLLADCIEKENLLNGHVDWTQNEETILAKKEIEDLYKWWKERVKKELDAEIDPIWTENQYEEDNARLIRLIKVRKYLWT